MTQPIPYDPELTALDFDEFHTLLADFLKGVPGSAWDVRTGTREHDWTLHQTLAHLVSVARMFNRAFDTALRGEPLVIVPGLAQREDLSGWNAAQIAALETLAPAVLIGDLLEELAAAQERARHLSPEDAERTTLLPVYNRPAPARHFIDWQLSHAGVIHAAQLTRARAQPPLWAQYTPDFTHRQLDRFTKHFSWAYWHTYAPPDQHATVNFHVNGEGGGDWHIIAAPDGGGVGDGAVLNADYTVDFATADVIFGVFTVELPLKAAIRSREVVTGDDWRAVFGLLRYFAASPPTTE